MAFKDSTDEKFNDQIGGSKLADSIFCLGAALVSN